MPAKSQIKAKLEGLAEAMGRVKANIAAAKESQGDVAEVAQEITQLRAQAEVLRRRHAEAEADLRETEAATLEKELPDARKLAGAASVEKAATAE